MFKWSTGPFKTLNLIFSVRKNMELEQNNSNLAICNFYKQTLHLFIETGFTNPNAFPNTINVNQKEKLQIFSRFYNLILNEKFDIKIILHWFVY